MDFLILSQEADRTTHWVRICIKLQSCIGSFYEQDYNKEEQHSCFLALQRSYHSYPSV